MAVTFDPAVDATFIAGAHGRDGAPEWGLAIVDLPEGDRCYARVDDAGLLAEMEATEWVGAGIDLVSNDGVNTVRP